MNILEDNMNNTLLEGDGLTESSSSSNVNDIDGLRKRMKEQQVRFEVNCSFWCLTHFSASFFLFQSELDQIRKKLNENEIKNARVVHDVRC